jgi:hypothetical protein
VPVQVLVHRLRQAYWPTWLSRITLARTRRARAVSEYDAGPRGDAYPFGRVRYFMERLRADQPVDPIEIETGWASGDVPLGPHHRTMGITASSPRSTSVGIYCCME